MNEFQPVEVDQTLKTLTVNEDSDSIELYVLYSDIHNVPLVITPVRFLSDHVGIILRGLRIRFKSFVGDLMMLFILPICQAQQLSKCSSTISRYAPSDAL